MTAPAERPDIDGLARAIGAAWRRGVEAILETGRLMADARAALGDDDWAALLVNLPFGPRYARMLVRIGADLRLATYRMRVPADTHTLYRLTTLTDAQFGQLLQRGIIHPTMPRRALPPANRSTNRADGEAVARTPDQGEAQFQALRTAWEKAWPIVRQRFRHWIDEQIEQPDGTADNEQPRQ